MERVEGRKRFYLDLLERVSWTAIQAAAAAVLITGFGVDSLKIAGAAAGASVLKCLLASRVGDSDSAAALPGVDGSAGS